MGQYYRDLAEELTQQKDKALKRGDDTARIQSRLDAVEREARLRTSELRQKHAVRIRLRLLGLLLIEQPKVICQAVLRPADDKCTPLTLDMCWDPLLGCVEAAVCSRCQKPTYEFQFGARKELICPACKASPGKAGR